MSSLDSRKSTPGPMHSPADQMIHRSTNLIGDENFVIPGSSLDSLSFIDDGGTYDSVPATGNSAANKDREMTFKYDTLEEQHRVAIETIRQLRQRLVRRTSIIDEIRRFYLRDIVAMRYIIADVLSDSEREQVWKQYESNLPSIDLKESLRLHAPTGTELQIKPCEMCGGQLELIRKDTDEVELLKKNLKDSKDRENRWREKLATLDAQSEKISREKAESTKSHLEEKKVLYSEMKKIKEEMAKVQSSSEATLRSNKKLRDELADLKALNNELSQTAARVTAIERELEAKKSYLETVTNQLASTRVSEKQAQDDLYGIRLEVQELRVGYEKSTQDLVLTNEELKHKSVEIENLERTLQDYSRELDSTSQQSKEKLKHIDKLESSSRNTVSEQAKKIRAQDQKIAELKHEIDERKKQYKTVEGNLLLVISEIQTCRLTIDELLSENQTLNLHLSENSDEIQVLEKEIDRMKSFIRDSASKVTSSGDDATVSLFRKFDEEFKEDSSEEIVTVGLREDASPGSSTGSMSRHHPPQGLMRALLKRRRSERESFRQMREKEKQLRPQLSRLDIDSILEQSKSFESEFPSESSSETGKIFSKPNKPSNPKSSSPVQPSTFEEIEEEEEEEYENEEIDEVEKNSAATTPSSLSQKKATASKQTLKRKVKVSVRKIPAPTEHNDESDSKEAGGGEEADQDFEEISETEEEEETEPENKTGDETKKVEPKLVKPRTKAKANQKMKRKPPGKTSEVLIQPSEAVESDITAAGDEEQVEEEEEEADLEEQEEETNGDDEVDADYGKGKVQEKKEKKEPKQLGKKQKKETEREARDADGAEIVDGISNEANKVLLKGGPNSPTQLSTAPSSLETSSSPLRAKTPERAPESLSPSLAPAAAPAVTDTGAAPVTVSATDTVQLTALNPPPFSATNFEQGLRTKLHELLTDKIGLNSANVAVNTCSSALHSVCQALDVSLETMWEGLSLNRKTFDFYEKIKRFFEGVLKCADSSATLEVLGQISGKLTSLSSVPMEKMTADWASEVSLSKELLNMLGPSGNAHCKGKPQGLAEYASGKVEITDSDMFLMQLADALAATQKMSKYGGQLRSKLSKDLTQVIQEWTDGKTAALNASTFDGAQAKKQITNLGKELAKTVAANEKSLAKIKELEAKSNELLKCESDLRDALKTIDKMTFSLEEAKAKVELLTSEVAAAKEDSKSSKKSLVEAQQKLDKALEEFQQSSGEFKRANDLVLKLTAEKEAILAEKNSVQEELNTVRQIEYTRLNLLVSKETQYEPFNQEGGMQTEFLSAPMDLRTVLSNKLSRSGVRNVPIVLSQAIGTLPGSGVDPYHVSSGTSMDDFAHGSSSGMNSRPLSHVNPYAPHSRAAERLDTGRSNDSYQFSISEYRAAPSALSYELSDLRSEHDKQLLHLMHPAPLLAPIVIDPNPPNSKARSRQSTSEPSLAIDGRRSNRSTPHRSEGREVSATGEINEEMSRPDSGAIIMEDESPLNSPRDEHMNASLSPSSSINSQVSMRHKANFDPVHQEMRDGIVYNHRASRNASVGTFRTNDKKPDKGRVDLDSLTVESSNYRAKANRARQQGINGYSNGPNSAKTSQQKGRNARYVFDEKYSSPEEEMARMQQHMLSSSTGALSQAGLASLKQSSITSDTMKKMRKELLSR